MQQTTPGANVCLLVVFEKIHFQLKNKTREYKMNKDCTFYW